MKVNPNIFREYDIRGIYNDDLTDEVAFHIGKACGTFYRRKGLKNIVLGLDARTSSPSLAKRLSDGLLSTGCDVSNVGMVPYPLIHFFTTTQGFDGGVYVTASHNTKEYNGIKPEYKNAEPMYGAELKQLEDTIEHENYMSGAGSYSEIDLTDTYVDFITKKFLFKKKFKVVLNAGNGVTGEVALRVFKKLNIQVLPINIEKDGEFPNGTPDPEDPAFVKLTLDAVKKSGADAGFGLDGDGDRFLAVDERGTAYAADRMLLLFSKAILASNPGAKIVFDVKCTSLADEVIKKYGGVPEIMQTGRAFFLSKVIKKEAIFGLEFAGHTYFADDYFGFDDGIYAILRTLKILNDTGKKLSELMAEFPKTVSSSEIKVPCSDDTKFKVISQIVSEVQASSGYTNPIFVDGVRANVTPTSWFLIRAKNTSPFLGVRMEARDEEDMSVVMAAVVKLLSNQGLHLDEI